MKWLANAQGGSRLHLDTDLDLDETFGDPCPGMRKKLVIRYYVRGFHGCTRVDEDPMDYLSTDIQIGYLPTADDPFGAKPPRNATQIAVDEIQKLRMVDATGRSTEVKEGKYASRTSMVKNVLLVAARPCRSRSSDCAHRSDASKDAVLPDALRDGLLLDVVLRIIICLCVDSDQVLGHV